MQEIQSERNTMFYTYHYLKGKADRLDLFFNRLYIQGSKRPFNSLIEAYCSSRRNSALYGLFAHGRYGDRWRFFDDDNQSKDVQDWIDTVDGKAAAIFLYCCNPESKTISSKESIVIHPKKLIRNFNYVTGTNLRLYFPGEGYIEDNPKRIKELTNELKD